jgi:hypothetical protein
MIEHKEKTYPDRDEMEDAIVEQMDEWTTVELFDYHRDQDLIEATREDFRHYMDSRYDLLKEAKQHRAELLQGMEIEDIVERYETHCS